MARGNGEQYTYISRQAIRYNIVEQMGEPLAEVKPHKDVLQFAPETTIRDVPEIDFFGYMKTHSTPTKTRSAVVRLSNAVSLETFKGDMDFLTNKGLYDRYEKSEEKNRGIAQAEIHRSYYRYTIAADLDHVGIDERDNVSIENKEKARRVNRLLDTVALLYRDIRGRREDLKPLFAIGGVYDVKNPVFQNVLEVKNNRVLVSSIQGVLFDSIKKDTYCGLIEGKFENDKEIKENLGAISMPEFFKKLKDNVDKYYTGKAE
jgi:CRISPR-associated protein Cst2